MYLNIIFNVIGGLGIFLYGMENMSGGMQKLAGKKLKKILAALTTNRIMAVLIGIFVTMLVQSSSVSTVMTIGFVNASLLTLKQALGVILGANIGTTVTGWLLVLNIGKYGLPITGAAAISYVFFKSDKARTRALTVMGLGLIFLGLDLMSNGLKPIRTMPEFIELFKLFNADTYFGAVKVAIVGACITGIVQSSAATLGITITLAVQGLIDYPTAVALVLGENVGTTVTAFLASLGATTNAKRAAYAHTIINTVGVIWVTAIFPLYIKFLGHIVDVENNITFGIATAHTMFNVLNVFLFMPFTGPLSSFLTKIVKDSGKSDEKVTKLDKLMVGTPSVVVGQTKTEVLTMGQNIKEMMFALEETFAKNEMISDLKLTRLQKIENDLDLYQKEISDVNFLILNKDLTDSMREETRKNLEVCDEYETISDYLMRIGKSIRKIQDNDIEINEKARKTLFDLNENIEILFREINLAYETKDKERFIRAIKQSNEITEKFRQARSFHLANVKEGSSAVFSTSYMDILNHYRRIRDHIFNIIEVFTRL
ncbi:Na/Pi cotransporter family protein [Fusobacterium perfoetens]|uniref:Na/Pi cotransporter family protein n=1 Tax=Fusobacterium perfoetens TaxID=852 RepID=UPI00159FE787|nr:Na/Pi cotransporter family protein [Fusobacterium perfoetens]MCF2624939.1 Na/Pi cotransporter family protein [Fusobacterium perfoetens]